MIDEKILSSVGNIYAIIVTRSIISIIFSLHYNVMDVIIKEIKNIRC